jgi:hypothetical protein
MIGAGVVVTLSMSVRAGEIPSNRPSAIPNGPDKKRGPAILRKELESRLLQQKYFENATCRAFSDYILTQNGLPPLGQTAPVRGTREDTNRAGENKNPPLFIDSVARRIKPRDAVKITADGDHAHWTMSLDREIEFARINKPARMLSMQTQYNFDINGRGNIGSCDLKNFTVQFKTSDSPEKTTQVMDLDACVDLFLKGAPNQMSLHRIARSVISYIRKDCANGMHYSLEAKTVKSPHPTVKQ